MECIWLTCVCVMNKFKHALPSLLQTYIGKLINILYSPCVNNTPTDVGCFESLTYTQVRVQISKMAVYILDVIVFV